MKFGSTCGAFACGEDVTRRIDTGDGWFDGTVISVIGEALFQGAGVTARANHLSPHILHSMLQIVNHPLDSNVVEMEKLSISRQRARVCGSYLDRR